VYGRLTEDHMPGVLKDSAADSITEICLHDPVTILLVLLLGSFPDLLFGGCELCTAAHAYGSGYLFSRE
jgi:hypothetical protein